MTRTVLHSRRSRTSCSILALATVMAVGATPAAAQSLLGSGSFATNGAGSANINNGVANLTTVTLNGGQTIIDWTPTDNAIGGGGITFQNSGTTALFTSSSDFAVLNRINQTDISRAIIMNGTVNARVSGVQRGSVYFYSPGGFIFGGSSVFSVGSLVVTASPIQLTGNNFINGAENTVVFGQALNPNAFISSSGTISANSFGFGVLPPGNSYVAMVAPRVAHSGSINVNGSAALVGAEAASINFSPDGLFDIQVTVGTDDDNGVHVTGDITGPEPGSATDRQSIYLVAVPKNDAITLLVGNGADLGFTLANDAAIDDAGVVVLSAGHDISNGAIGAKSAAPGTGLADFWFTGAHATNNVIGEATGSAFIYSVAPSQPLTVFDSSLSVHAANNLWMNAGPGTTLTVAGDVSLSTDRGSSIEGGSATAGNTYLYALDDGILTIGGNLMMTADGYGGTSSTSGLAGGTGTGGHVLVQAGGGSLTVGGDTYLSASGYGGWGSGTNGGVGVGGFVQVASFSTPDTGTLTLSGALSAYAQGTGGESSWGFTTGDGAGGHIQIRAQANSSIAIADGIFGDASGRGGFTNFQVHGGNGEGGDIELQAQGGNASLNAGGNVTLVANGEAGSGGECIVCGGIGGDGLGGNVIVGANSGANNLLTLPGTLTLTANGYGGVGVDADGGTGTGGHVQLYAGDGSTVTLAGNLTAHADGYGGERVNGGYGGDNPTIAGDGIGGLAELLTFGTGDPQLLLAGSAFLHADGFGGNVVQIAGGTGGNGTGGVAGVYANAGDIDVDGSLIASALGEGGSADGGWGGDGTGRNAEIFATAGGNVTIGGPVVLDVVGSGGDGDFGGDGVGGGIVDDLGVGTDGAHIFVKNGSVTVTGVTTLDASGIGGNGANGGAGGDAQGGWTTIHARNTNDGQSNITLSTAFIRADATGGAGGDGTSGNQGGDGGDGGNATAGVVGITANAGNGHVAVTFANASAMATGGTGGDGGNGDNLAGGNGGDGGNAEGGSATVGTTSGGNGEALASNLGTATFTTVSMDTSATGGDGGAGNFGTPDGNGGAGGDGDGGGSLLLVRGSTVSVTGTTTLIANGSGGDGGFGGGDFGTQGAGGDGYAGEVYVEATSRFMIPAQRGTLNTGAITGSAIGAGGLGSVDGTGILEGGSRVIVDRSTVNIASLDFNIGGDIVDPGADPSRIAITNATVDVDTTFDFSTIGDLSFYIDNGSLTAGTLALTAGNFITDEELPAPTSRGTAFASNLSVTSGGDFIADANFNVTNGIDITVPGSIRFGDATTVSFIDLDAQGGSIDLDNLTADGDIFLNANGLIDIGTVQAGFFHADAGTTFTSLGITSDSNIQINSVGNVSTGNLDAGLTADEFSSKAIRIDTDTGSVLVGDIVALGGIDITAGGSVTGGNVTTGDVLFTDALGAISYGNISAGLVNPQPPTEPASVGLNSATSISVGNIDAAQIIGLITSGSLVAGDLSSGTDILGLVSGNMTIGDIDADGRVLLADSSMFADAGGVIGGGTDSDIDIESIFAATPVATGGSITVGDVLAGSFTAAAGTSLTTGLIDTDSEIELGANGAITTGDLDAGDFVLANGGSITTGDIDASSVDMTSTSGNITTGDIFAFGDVELDAFGDILTGDILAGSIDLFAGDDIATGDLTTQQFVLLDLGDGGITTQLYPGASITLEAGDDIATGNIFSIDGVYADAGGSISTGWIFANDFVELYAGDDISSGYIDAGQYIYTDSGGDQSLGNLTAGWDIDLNAGGGIAFGDADAGIEFEFEADGSVTGGDVVAGLTIEGEAGGSVSLGNLTAGFDPNEEVDDDTFSVGIQAIGSISVGNVQGAERVGFATFGNLTTGSIQTGWDFFAFADGAITTGAITTGAGDQVFMSGTDLFLEAGGGEDSDFDPDAALAMNPTATDSSITINGAVNTGQFRAAAGTGLTTQAITASGDIHASAGGTATLNGVWTSGDDVDLASNDIDIAASGGINAADGVGLFSTNATQALIGDGLTGTGYALSNAEFGRISGYDVGIGARGDASAAIDMLIGDLTVTGPLAGSTIEGADEVLAFAVGDIDSETISGVIRVNGDVAATGFGSANAIEFYATRFELDAATGSVSILSSGSTLGGELGLYADRIHVAEGAILNQLAANPTYTGYQQDLNEEATVQRPEGVLRADTLWIESDNLQSVLIQNTGTTDAPAGFLVREAFVNDDEEVAGPAGSINLVVNGQVVTEGGTLTGIEARDALIDEETDITPFTANSTINGCPLTGACIIAPPPPPPTADVVDNQIDLITGGGLGDGEFDDNQEGEEGSSSPISPPQPLFDTRPLIPSSDVNDPVSGTGNPALLGTSECIDDDETQCGTEKETGQ